MDTLHDTAASTPIPTQVSPLTVDAFITKWQRIQTKERTASQTHFNDLCDLLGVAKPLDVDPDGTFYTFERHVTKSIGGKGFADVFKQGHFAWEYKGKRSNLQDAYVQLLLYRDDLENPPLLVVSDLETIQIHTNFTGTPKQVYTLTLEDLRDPERLALLKNVFEHPELLNPKYKRERITREASQQIGSVAQTLRARGHDAQEVAHFLMQVIFALFAEDVGLLPNSLVTQILEKTSRTPERAQLYLSQLFEAMATGGEVLLEDVAYFNGGLFEGSTALPLEVGELEILLSAAKLDWSEVEPSIFGTLFERSLDPAKRSQLGAHYTSREDILRVVEPVVIAPLKEEWDTIRNGIEAYLEGEAQKTKTSKKKREKNVEQPLTAFLERLQTLKVLDPACGSGNFLYVAMQQLKELEKEVVSFAWSIGVPGFALVGPRQFYGLEVNVFAHELASIVVWIGYLQWNHLNGISNARIPILERLNNIRRQDALLDGGKETEWPEADYIVGNPPFLGNYKLRDELSDIYVDTLYKVYGGRLPNKADLVCYWFEKARGYIAEGKAKRAGLIATNSIRGGANSKVLSAIKESGDIFMAYADEPWVQEGASVRVSIVAFDDGTQLSRHLDGQAVDTINAYLTASVSLDKAVKLGENADLSFEGPSPKGKFDIDGEMARAWLQALNPEGVSNADVLKPYIGGQDITGHNKDRWIIDFQGKSLEEAEQYLLPMAWVREHVKPKRDKVKMKSRRENWWLFGSPAAGMRGALRPLERFMVTSRVSKHRFFIWSNVETLPSDSTTVIAKDDDYTFGILNSAIHVLWALRKGTSLGKGNDPRYTPTTCFETFPFPYPTPKGKADIEKWAKYLGDVRLQLLDADNALTMTKLYNQLTELRETRDCSQPAYALLVAYEKLDEAIYTAYGWEYPLSDEEVLERLLKLNLERAESSE